MDLSGFDLSEENQAKLSEMIVSETEGLASKKNELLGKLHREKESGKAMAEKYQNILDKFGITSEDDIDTAIESLSGKAGESKKADIELKRLQRELEKANSGRDTYYKQLSDLQIDSAIKSELSKHNVKPELVDALALHIKTQNKFELVQDGSTFKASNSDGFSPVEVISEWAKSDASKPWRAAPINSGGGSQGSQANGGESLKGLSLAQISEIKDDTKRRQAMRENGFLK